MILIKYTDQIGTTCIPGKNFFCMNSFIALESKSWSFCIQGPVKVIPQVFLNGLRSSKQVSLAGFEGQAD